MGMDKKWGRERKKLNKKGSEVFQIWDSNEHLLIFLFTWK